MKNLQITFLIIFGCFLSMQAVRHVHIYSFGFEESVLAPASAFYDMKEAVRLEASTSELLAEYNAGREEIQKLRKANPDMDLFAMRQGHAELFARNDALASELRQRQEKSRELRDIWLFSAAGLVLIGIGSVLYIRGYEWTGMSLIVPGFLELVWWSAPSFTLGGAVREHDLLLLNKIILTVIAFALLYSLWLIAQRRRRKLEDTSA